MNKKFGRKEKVVIFAARFRRSGFWIIENIGKISTSKYRKNT